MKRLLLVLAGAGLMSLFGAGSAGAVANVELSQIINLGVLSVDVLNENEVTVAAPNVPMSSVAVAATCRPTGSTGTLGVNTQRIYVDNPGAADNGWSLSIAATGGATAVWDSGTQTYDFNDPNTGGCGDGGDADSLAGLLTVNPASSTLTAACSGTCTNSSITASASDNFEQTVTDAIELYNAGAGSDNIWRGYVTGVGLTQSIPAGQAAGNYTVDMTLTVVAL